jgi:hypothetical protein
MTVDPYGVVPAQQREAAAELLKKTLGLTKNAATVTELARYGLQIGCKCDGCTLEASKVTKKNPC